MNFQSMLIWNYQLPRKKNLMLLNSNVYIVLTIIFSIVLYLVITIAVPASIAKMSVKRDTPTSKFDLDDAFDSIIALTNDHTILQSLPTEVAKEKQSELRRIASDSADVYADRKQKIDERYKKLLQYQEVLINFRQEIEIGQ